MNPRMDFSRFPRRSLPAHETLFFEEEPSRELYLLLSGSLGVFRNEIQVATIDEPLAMVGEISALTGEPRNATVRALRPASLVVVADPDQLFAEYPQLGAKLARLLARRLAAMNERFVELKSLVARTTAPVADAAAETREPTLRLPAAARPQAPAVPAATTAGEVSLEVLEALSDLLDMDPGLGAGT